MAATLLLPLARPAAAQQLDWRLRATLYGDNTEFFTPYRVGETILGGQVTTWLAGKPGPRTELRVGFFADRRWGSNEFTDSIKPVLAFRYQTQHTLAVLGTLETVNRHGLLEPAMVTTRELTTPIEYGMQWVENRGRFTGNTWVNWQKLNTPAEREQFELATVLGLKATRVLDFKAQHLWYHRGGQLFDANAPVTNNRVTAVGAVIHDSLRVVGKASLEVDELWSNGHIDPNYPGGRPDKGYGTYVRATVTPWNAVELFGILWRGKDFSGDDGDQNYSSTGHNPSFYRSSRKYLELGVKRSVPIEGGTTLDAEWRFHQIDDEKSIAFFNSRWEISYRIVVRVPLDVSLKR